MCFKSLILLTFIFHAYATFAQTENLALNPGMENITACPLVMPALTPSETNLVPSWRASHSEVFIHRELSYFGENNPSCEFSTTAWPGGISSPLSRTTTSLTPLDQITNKVFGGFWVNYVSPRVEYFTGSLKDPLIQGITYDVSYWVARALDFTSISLKHFGAYFHEEGFVYPAQNLPFTTAQGYHLDVEPQVQVIRSQPNQSFLSHDWMEISGSFKVQSPNLNKVTLGHFATFSPTAPQEGIDFERASPGITTNQAYYFIDDLSVSCDSKSSINTNLSGAINELAQGGDLNEISCEELLEFYPVLENTHQYQWQQVITNTENSNTQNLTQNYTQPHQENLSFFKDPAPLNQGYWEGLEVQVNLGSKCHSGVNYNPPFKFTQSNKTVFRVKNLKLAAKPTSNEVHSLDSNSQNTYDLITGITQPTHFNVETNILDSDGLQISIQRDNEPEYQVSLSDLKQYYWSQAGEYKVRFFNKFSSYCHPELEFKILVIEYSKGSLTPIFIPNAFSPDFDGINDNFQVFAKNPEQLSQLTLSIFDRWGNFLFKQKSNSPDDLKWNGEFRGERMGVGIYIYSLEYTYSNGEFSKRETLSGDVTLTSKR